MNNSMPDSHGIMASAATMAAIKLLGVKVSFERLARFLSAIGAEGTYNGTDIYEVMQGVHDMVSAALGYLVSPEDEAKLHDVGMKMDDEAKLHDVGMKMDDEAFEKMVSELEEGGHA